MNTNLDNYLSPTECLEKNMLNPNEEVLKARDENYYLRNEIMEIIKENDDDDEDEKNFENPIMDKEKKRKINGTL